MTEIKICCISSHDEARIALAAGADILGLVSAMPSGPGVIDEDLIASIASLAASASIASLAASASIASLAASASIAASITAQTFLLTSLCEPEAIIAQHRRCGTTAIQLCDALPPGSYARLREALPTIRLVQVVHVTSAVSYDEAMAAARDVDALLLDSGNPSLRVKELGGTGRVHDWSISSRICADAGVPVFLAGGLRPENVSEALAITGATGVDICSGVRTDGRLDPEKLAQFVGAVRAARVSRQSAVGGRQ